MNNFINIVSKYKLLAIFSIILFFSTVLIVNDENTKLNLCAMSVLIFILQYALELFNFYNKNGSNH